MRIIYTSKGMSKMFGGALSIEKYGIYYLKNYHLPNFNTNLSSNKESVDRNLFTSLNKAEPSVS
jgi:hypothetical protein